jgi:hypothetical protein
MVTAASEKEVKAGGNGGLIIAGLQQGYPGKIMGGRPTGISSQVAQLQRFSRRIRILINHESRIPPQSEPYFATTIYESSADYRHIVSRPAKKSLFLKIPGRWKEMGRPAENRVTD